MQAMAEVILQGVAMSPWSSAGNAICTHWSADRTYERYGAGKGAECGGSDA